MEKYLGSFNNLLMIEKCANGEWILVRCSNMVQRTIDGENKYTIAPWGGDYYLVAKDLDTIFFADIKTKTK
jgi:hypothetical protein